MNASVIIKRAHKEKRVTFREVWDACPYRTAFGIPAGTPENMIDRAKLVVGLIGDQQRFTSTELVDIVAIILTGATVLVMCDQRATREQARADIIFALRRPEGSA